MDNPGLLRQLQSDTRLPLPFCAAVLSLGLSLFQPQEGFPPSPAVNFILARKRKGKQQVPAESLFVRKIITFTESKHGRFLPRSPSPELITWGLGRWVSQHVFPHQLCGSAGEEKGGNRWWVGRGTRQHVPQRLSILRLFLSSSAVWEVAGTVHDQGFWIPAARHLSQFLQMSIFALGQLT